MVLIDSIRFEHEKISHTLDRGETAEPLAINLWQLEEDTHTRTRCRRVSILMTNDKRWQDPAWRSYIYLCSYTMSITFFVAFLGALLIQAQDQSGFISIDCGASDSYTDSTTGINYTSDANFIDTGVSRPVASELINNQYIYQRQLGNVRSFPEGKRNCYKINITRGSKYLIRTTFLYGNYDTLMEPPTFDILLGANRWLTVTFTDAITAQTGEIIHVPSLDYIQICLVKTGDGKPFISAIEIRTLKDDTYITQSGSLQTVGRLDLGSNKTYRYKDDVYDRFWYAFNSSRYAQSSASVPANSLKQNVYRVPEIVMSTAVTPVNASAPWVISWKLDHPTDQFYVYMHFMEIQELPQNQTREFSITLNGELRTPKFSPEYGSVNTIQSTSAISGVEINISLEMTESSTLSPSINAIEIYKVIDFQQSDTNQGDVDAITTIKSVYGVKKDWEGDPCAPEAYLWDGLNCSYNGNNSPRITSLNLSSSGLSGKIVRSISKLDMLEKLDLSNNNLNGEIPDYLSHLQHLKIINLEKNNLSGTIPSALIEKSKKGSLSLSVDQNSHLCETGQCNEKKKKNIITPLVASISGVLILLVAVAILWILKRRSKEIFRALMGENDQSETSLHTTKEDDSFLQLKKQTYSYSDVLKITNNFNTIIGKGGFGTVYLGYIDDTPVAVKMLSPSAVHGYQQFQAEVKILMRVHHKNLTSLIGYCNEGTNMCLVYEYMANGNLHEHLSGNHSQSKFLSWEDRLRIALDAALGLEYLQNGCKPPIFHRDVKSTNILLNENFQAKLSDFGLSKVFPTDGESHVSTIVAGTLGYLDPHYTISSRLTEKSDVYSFGVVLLEIITNQPVMARNQEKGHISDRVRSLIAKGNIKGIVDSRLEGDFDNNSAWKAVEIAMACVALNPNDRPIMSVVVIELKETLATALTRTKHIGGASSRHSESEEQISVNLARPISCPWRGKSFP